MMRVRIPGVGRQCSCDRLVCAIDFSLAQVCMPEVRQRGCVVCCAAFQDLDRASDLARPQKCRSQFRVRRPVGRIER